MPPATTDSCAVRSQSVVPTQALVLMNDQFVESQAKYLAERVLRDWPEDQQVQAMLTIALGHAPSLQQSSQAQNFVRTQSQMSDRVDALTDLSHVIFNSSEFIHIP